MEHGVSDVDEVCAAYCDSDKPGEGDTLTTSAADVPSTDRRVVYLDSDKPGEGGTQTTSAIDVPSTDRRTHQGSGTRRTRFATSFDHSHIGALFRKHRKAWRFRQLSVTKLLTVIVRI